MNKNIIGILVCILFIGTCFTPSINGYFNEVILDRDNENIVLSSNNLQETFYPTDDAYISMHGPDVNTGYLTYLSIRNRYGDTSDWGAEILIRFDISSIPSGAHIDSANFYLYYYQWADNYPAGRPLTCYRITSDWNENNVTWNTRPSISNSVTYTAIVPSYFGWIEWDVTDDVQNFIDGDMDNYGWQMIDEQYWGGPGIPLVYCYSKEYGSSTPYLEINYDVNNPPNKPSKPSGPSSGYVGNLLAFSTTATDPDNDLIQYGWDWNGDSIVDEWSEFLPSGISCYKTHQWNYPGTYGIKVKAKDINGAVSGWSYVKTVEILVQNQPPNTPSNPDPSNHAIDVDINTDLSWNGGDPDIGDTVTYDVFFGSMLPLPKVASNITTTVFDPGTLVNSLTYFWSIVAWDNYGASRVGPGWDFTTIKANSPPNKPSKPVGQINGSKGILYLYTTNTTDFDGDQVYYLWDWGDDSFSEWLGPYDSGMLADASHSWSEGSYSIRVKARDTNELESDWSDPLVVTMPRNRAINTPFIRFLQQHPILYQLLQRLLNF